MFYYTYKITNVINDKIYVGVHKTAKLDDGYMGSGTAIIAAIKKYGVQKFKKEILKQFDSYKDALAHEKEIVTPEFLLREDVYNQRRGGTGGFDHINSLPVNERPNIKRLRKLQLEGKLTSGGTQHWTTESWEKLRERQLGFDPNNWGKLSDARKEEVRKKISLAGSNEGNSQFGTVWCVKENAKDCNSRQSFKKVNIPPGWISTTEWKERRKNKNNSAYGKHWYNDGNGNNFLLLPTDGRVKNLIKGRIR